MCGPSSGAAVGYHGDGTIVPQMESRRTDRVSAKRWMSKNESATDPGASGANDALAADDLLARFLEVARIGRAVYTAEGLRLFLTTPSPRFGGRTGLHLLRAGDCDRVISVLAADYEGLS
jgi:hypothetical protein